MAQRNRSASGTTDAAVTAERPALSISPEKVCFIALKARQFDVKDAPTLEDEGSDPADDGMLEVLEDRGNDPVRRELSAFIGALNVDEQVDLIALTWLGRGDELVTDWDKLRDLASSRQNARTADYLLGMPLLADLLEEGLAELGINPGDYTGDLAQ